MGHIKHQSIMYTLLLLTGCLGFFCFYNTSKRLRWVAPGRVEAYLQSHAALARMLGMTSLLLNVTVLVLVDGPLMGLLHFFLLLMAAGCYIVGIAPLKLLKLSRIIALTALCLVVELLIF